MRTSLKLLILSVIMIVLVACNIFTCKRPDVYKDNLLGIIYNTLGTVDINNIKENHIMMDVLHRYIKEHPQYNTFAIIELPIANLAGNTSTGIFIGPGYEELYKDIYYDKVLDTINIQTVKVYIISDRRQNKIIKDDWQNMNPTDSVVIGSYSNRVSYYAYENFMWRALYVYKQNGKYNTIDRLDTIMFVKEVPSSIRFSSPDNDSCLDL